MSSESLHEDAGKLGPQVIDQHRAIVSLMEELEAVDWYNQRAKATDNAELRAILEHNRDEEKEHAAMALEWLRRSDPTLSRHLETFLFTDGPITGIEAIMEDKGGGDIAGAGANDDDGSLGIGSLRSDKGESAK
ncbi:MAG: ferritin [Rhodospirillales bacterium]|nr:ferritin [Rhodospirillales bacterium]